MLGRRPHSCAIFMRPPLIQFRGGCLAGWADITEARSSRRGQLDKRRGKQMSACPCTGSTQLSTCCYFHWATSEWSLQRRWVTLEGIYWETKLPSNGIYTAAIHTLLLPSDSLWMESTEKMAPGWNQGWDQEQLPWMDWGSAIDIVIVHFMITYNHFIILHDAITYYKPELCNNY
jgi:hypothetical protein